VRPGQRRYLESISLDPVPDRRGVARPGAKGDRLNDTIPLAWGADVSIFIGMPLMPQSFAGVRRHAYHRECTCTDKSDSVAVIALRSG
jgi:hypothetical protein